MFGFSEQVSKLIIEYRCFLGFRLSNATSISLFQRGGDTLSILFLTIGVPLKSLGLALTSPTKLFTYRSCCFLISALISLLKDSNFALLFAIPDFFFAFA